MEIPLNLLHFQSVPKYLNGFESKPSNPQPPSFAPNLELHQPRNKGFGVPFLPMPGESSSRRRHLKPISNTSNRALSHALASATKASTAPSKGNVCYMISRAFLTLHSRMVFKGISMDLIIGLPAFKGKTIIMVIFYQLSKYGHFFGLLSNFSSASVVIFVTDFVQLHGIPVEIRTIELWRELHRLQGTTFITSMDYHPQAGDQNNALYNVMLRIVPPLGNKYYHGSNIGITRPTKPLLK
ncbi:uncharacterized protein LOC105798181 isoform X1 [Gossypium raimondii]|nr:uncharacterized protein LOC105798181 isoform X1 [Gossypium raimondii]